MSFVLLGILNSQAAGGGVPVGWINLFTDETGNGWYGLAVDSQNNLIAAGYRNDNLREPYVVKFDIDGQVVWQRNLSAYDLRINGVDVDSNDDIYIAGTLYSGSDTYAYGAKFTSAGSASWQRYIGQTGLDLGYNGVGVLGSSAFYVGVYDDFGDKYQGVTKRANSNGTVQESFMWQERRGASAQAVVSDGTNIFVASNDGEFSDLNYTVVKSDSNGNIVTDISVQSTNNAQEQPYGLALDSSGNILVNGRAEEGFSTYGATLTSLNSALTSINWGRNLSSSSGNTFGRGVVVDSANNVYVSGYGRSPNGSREDMYLAKYDSSGVIQWQRRFGAGTQSINFSMAINSLDEIYIGGWVEDSANLGSGRFFTIAKVPADGAGVGSYNLGGATFEYAESDFTDAASGLVTEAIGLNKSNFGPSDVSTVFTQETTTGTSETVEVLG